MKKYKSHKIIEAGKIIRITEVKGGGATIEMEGEDPVVVGESYMKRFKLSKAFGDSQGVDGYYVRYADGYESWTPNKAFEEGYTEAAKAGGELSGSEAVFGFVAWLTTRGQKTVMSATHSSAAVVPLVDAFCKANKLEEPAADYHKRLKHPSKDI